MEVGLDLVYKENDKVEYIDILNYKGINECKTPEEIKKEAETIGLDLTKNISKRIDVI
jgi:hypothetical protein